MNVRPSPAVARVSRPAFAYRLRAEPGPEHGTAGGLKPDHPPVIQDELAHEGFRRGRQCVIPMRCCAGSVRAFALSWRLMIHRLAVPMIGVAEWHQLQGRVLGRILPDIHPTQGKTGRGALCRSSSLEPESVA